MDAKNGTENRSAYWIDQAEYDLETARAMLQTGRYLYVGFMCQQTVEKALKGVIAKQGVFPPKVHDLLRLAELANVSGILARNKTAFLTNCTLCILRHGIPLIKNGSSVC